MTAFPGDVIVAAEEEEADVATVDAAEERTRRTARRASRSRSRSRRASREVALLLSARELRAGSGDERFRWS
jgi:hypothetical protein